MPAPSSVSSLSLLIANICIAEPRSASLSPSVLPSGGLQFERVIQGDIPYPLRIGPRYSAGTAPTKAKARAASTYCMNVLVLRTGSSPFIFRVALVLPRFCRWRVTGRVLDMHADQSCTCPSCGKQFAFGNVMEVGVGPVSLKIGVPVRDKRSHSMCDTTTTYRCSSPVYCTARSGILL